MLAANTGLTVREIKARCVEGGSDGLLAWASCVISDGIKLDDMATRRGRDGAHFLTYPTKQTDAGAKYSYFGPISAETSKAVEDAVLARRAALARAATVAGADAT